MTLNAPNLYIAGNLFDGTNPNRLALAGCSFTWGEESRFDFAGPATMSGQLRIGSTMPTYLTVGASVGLVDPASGRCLFAGHLATLQAGPDPSAGGSIRVSFTAASPLTDLANHNLAVDWADTTQAGRFTALGAAAPRGWTLQGYNGSAFEWAGGAGRQRYKKENYLRLLGLYCRGILARYHDTSAYVPGTGLVKRLTVTGERKGTAPTAAAPAPAGDWKTDSTRPENATGIAVLPAALVVRDIEWEKNPEDTITDVTVTTFGGAVLDAGEDSAGFDFWMSVYVNNQTLQDKYGFRQLGLEISQLPSTGAVDPYITQLVNHWLDADTQWRPTGITIPDSRKVATAPLLNLLAVDTRHMAALNVQGAVGLQPGKIHAYVHKGSATWTGKKWITDLTLGRTLD